MLRAGDEPARVFEAEGRGFDSLRARHFSRPTIEMPNTNFPSLTKRAQHEAISNGHRIDALGLGVRNTRAGDSIRHATSEGTNRMGIRLSGRRKHDFHGHDRRPERVRGTTATNDRELDARGAFGLRADDRDYRVTSRQMHRMAKRLRRSGV